MYLHSFSYGTYHLYLILDAYCDLYLAGESRGLGMLQKLSKTFVMSVLISMFQKIVTKLLFFQHNVYHNQRLLLLHNYPEFSLVYRILSLLMAMTMLGSFVKLIQTLWVSEIEYELRNHLEFGDISGCMSCFLEPSVFYWCSGLFYGAFIIMTYLLPRRPLEGSHVQTTDRGYQVIKYNIIIYYMLYSLCSFLQYTHASSDPTKAMLKVELKDQAQTYVYMIPAIHYLYYASSHVKTPLAQFREMLWLLWYTNQFTYNALNSFYRAHIWFKGEVFVLFVLQRLAMMRIQWFLIRHSIQKLYRWDVDYFWWILLEECQRRGTRVLWSERSTRLLQDIGDDIRANAITAPHVFKSHDDLWASYIQLQPNRRDEGIS